MKRNVYVIVVMSVWVVVIAMYAPAITANTDIISRSRKTNSIISKELIIS